MSCPVAIIAGLGSGTGTGAATARLFARKGYAIALISRNSETLNSVAQEITAAGAKALIYPVDVYSAVSMTDVFTAIKKDYPAPQYCFRMALWNTAGHFVWKKFLDVTPQDVHSVMQEDVEAGFEFSRQAIPLFLENDLDSQGSRGALLFTGATASLRGNIMTSTFAAGCFALRALSQSLAKEFSKSNIHVIHAIIDGEILTDNTRKRHNYDAAFEANEDVRLAPEDVAETYMYLTSQKRSAWTWELDLRPSHEKW
ncbi:short-chain dehydrogenase/reductase SDR [Hymenopellis radicata]|nr:short-chain dehydrogenase/reductase SDR [Hymenopellis radicata]